MRRALGYDLLIGLILHLVQLSTLHAQSIPLSLEPLVESNASAQISPVPDEDPFEEASRFLRDPLLLNEASKEELQQLPLLSGALVDLLLLHREVLGPLLHLNELQGIPGFTPELIRQLAPYVRVLPPGSFSRVHPLSFLGLTQDFLCRVTGMLTGTSEQIAAAWAGNRQRWRLWHRTQSKNV
ncbi:MAG: helix-hairpin-helix domain-containing protein, partial [Sphingomonadales bacterium]